MKKNYFKLLILVIMSFALSVSQSQNILYDGDFSQTTEIIPFDTPSPPINVWAYWVNYYGNGSEASPIVVDGICNFHIINPGDAAWNVQLVQWGFPLIQGHSYQLSFDVRADSNRSFGVYLGEDGGNWTTLIGFDRYLYDATTEWQTIHIEFEAYTVFPLHKLSFELGADTTTTYFDNIVLTDLGPGEPKLNLMNMPPSGSTADAGPEDLNGDLEYSVFNFTVGEPGTGTEGDGYISWSITNITDGGTLHDSGSIYDISVATSFITLLPNKTYYLSSFLVDNDGTPLGNPKSAYNLTVNTYGYNTVADITALRAHVAANGEGLYYEITGESLVNQRNDFHNRLWLQDSHISGLMIVDIDAVISTHFSIGDKVTGFKGQARYLNDSKITLIPSVDSGVLESSGNPVIPQVVTISDFNSDYVNYESEIIELQNVTIAEGNGFEVFNPGSIYHVTDDNMNTVLMYIDYYDADHIGTVIPNTTLSSLTAVAGHFGGVAQIYPRSLSDFSTGSSNLLYDGDFSLTTEIIPDIGASPPINTWTFWVNYYGNGSEANPTVVYGVCNFNIINPGDQTWNVQLEQYGFPLIQGHSYELSFDVKADADRSFGVYLGEFGGNWTTLIGYDRYLYDATTEWQTISIDFDAFAVFPLHKLSFEMGADNTTTYFDNIVLTDLGVKEHSISILGTAVNGWNEDVTMETTDGVNYVLYNYPLKEGELKFRQDNDWIVNWGGDSFPIGIGWPNGPGIPIHFANNYDITFNRLTGEYSFTCLDNCPASIGILGSALNGWSDDIDMQTTDGKTYILNNFFLTTGEVKFRQDNSWEINWGGDTFPSGIATRDGPGIPVNRGRYNITFNIETGEYNFAWLNIDIVGSALNGWSNGIDMHSEDGKNYTLEDYYFSSGEVKFRVNQNWTTNWGGDTFPSGIAFLNGPNIPVLEGTYNVTFNRLSREYNFMATTCPNPEIQCPWDIYVENFPGMCGAYVDSPEVVPAANCGGEISIEQTSGLPSGSFFPVGTTKNTFVLTNSTGDIATCNFNVIVYDIEPPVISDLNELYEPLWPPNHKMVQIPIEYNVTDNCGSTTTELYITSNEPENGLGDGDKSPDWEIIDEHNVLLRAERSGNGNGRVYYINVRVFDDSWNNTERQIKISVPHDNGKITEEFIKSDRIKNNFILYPNGVDDIIHLKGLISLTNSSYSVYDMFGVIKRNGIIRNNQINVQNLPQGLYILKFGSDDGYFFKKFIKN